MQALREARSPAAAVKGATPPSQGTHFLADSAVTTSILA